VGGALVRIYEDLRTVQRRVGIVQALVALALACLVVYFWHLQVIRGKYFRDLAENNRIRAVPIPAPRGPLFDRKGRILAENRSSFNVVVTSERKDELGGALERLSRLIAFDPAEVKERLNTQGPRFRTVVVKADASDEDVATIEARRLEEPEASVDVVPLRSYPLGTGLAHSLGYVGEISDRQLESAAFEKLEPGSIVGQAGVELQYNRELMGRDGLRRIVVNSRGVEVTEAQRLPPVDGPPATLTIDLDLQAAVVEAMAGKSGSVVAIDPGTGDILAYLSTPAFDPNSFSAGIRAAEWNELLKDSEKPLLNRPIQGGYAPGSTFKIVNALAALQERVITPQTRFHCPGYLSIYNTVFRCHKETGHGWVDMTQAIALSCNVYFYNVGVRLEIERLSKYAHLVGFAQPTGVDLPHELPGLFQDPEWKMRTQQARWFPAETVSVAIGQAMSVTPMQLLRAAAVVASGGKLVTPHLMKAVGGKAVGYAPPRDLGFRPEVIAAVRDAMISVVNEGTGMRAKLEGIQVAGKTGSAQVVTHARLETNKKAHEYQPHAWFVCFAPADHPRVAMVVLVEHGASGMISAAPVAGQILSRYFGVPPIGPGMNVPPDNPPMEPSPQPLKAQLAPPSPTVAQTARPD
jgi:penicillin-binding protein 2